MNKAKCHIIKWEWEVLSYCMLPFLQTLDLIRLQRVSTGFKECVDIGLNDSNLVLGGSSNKNAGIQSMWKFINPRFQTALLKKSMLERFSSISKKGLSTNYKSEHSVFCNDEASVCILLFYLRQQKPRILNHLLHCIVPRWAPSNRRLFRQMHLRIEMYYNNLQHTKKSIKQSKRRKQTCMSNPSNSSITSVLNECKNDLSPIQSLTEANLRRHDDDRKRKRSNSNRKIKKPKLYAEEYQKDVVVQDDFKEYSDDSPVVVPLPLEARSVDSRSEGSLVDFIVNDDEELSSVSSSSSEKEIDYPDDESDNSSQCTSDLSGVYSDED